MTSPIPVDDKSYTCGAQVLYLSTTSPILVKTLSASAFRQLTFLRMAFFKKMLKKINKKWYPQSVLVGSPVTTAQVAKRLAAESTVSPADVAAVLTSLGPVMADYMSQGRSVKLDGIGSFYFTAVSAKGGVDAAEKVSANQIVGVRVRFNPETHYERGGGSRVATRGLTDTPIEWEEWKGEEKKKKEKKKEEGGIGQHGN